jgi:hypothetical protein
MVVVRDVHVSVPGEDADAEGIGLTVTVTVDEYGQPPVDVPLTV